VVTLIGVEEHWAFDGIDRPARALAQDRQDGSLVLSDHGDTSAHLADLGTGRLSFMDEQGVGTLSSGGRAARSRPASMPDGASLASRGARPGRACLRGPSSG
jgi:hypothetical protein